MPRREDERLRDILMAAETVREYLIGYSRDSFVDDSRMRSAVLYQLMIVGEAASALTQGFRGRHTDISWSLIIDFRKRVIHGYHDVDWDVVWDTAILDLPELIDQIAAVLAQEFPTMEANEAEAEK